MKVIILFLFLINLTWAQPPLLDALICSKKFLGISKRTKLKDVNLNDLNAFKERFFYFKKIVEKDNKNFIQMVEDKKPGLYFDLENSILKELNDRILTDKDLVTALINYHKELLYENISNSPLLLKAIKAKYSDFKSLRFIMNEDTPEIQEALQIAHENANKQFKDQIAQSFIAAKLNSEKGLAAKPEFWHLAGVGANADQAGMAARFARTLGESPQILIQNFNSIKSTLDHKVRQIELLRKKIEKEIPHSEKILVPSQSNPQKFVLSKSALRILRKINPPEPTASSYAEETQRMFKKMFDIDLSLKDVQNLKSYISLVDQFSPGIVVKKRVTVDKNKTPYGAIMVDFTDQNGRNLKGTIEALLNSKTSIQAIIGARLNEKKETLDLIMRKNKFTTALKKALNFSKRKVFFSGDDGTALLDKALTLEEKINTVKELSKHENPGDFRLVFVGKCRSCDIDGEDLEKKLRKELEGNFISLKKSNQIILAIDLVDENAINIIIGGKANLLIKKQVREIVIKLFGAEQERLNQVLLVAP